MTLFEQKNTCEAAQGCVYKGIREGEGGGR